MRILTFSIIFLIIIFGTVCFAGSQASYIFQQRQSRDYIFEQTMELLKEHNFPILSSSSEKGIIRTSVVFINRKGPPDFSVIYIISIEENPNGARIDVNAKIMAHKGEKSRVPRDEVKSAWWIIKALVKRVGR